MNYTVRLREEAELDLAQAAEWYESQRDGLGHEFLNEFNSTFETMALHPQSFPVVHRGTHRALIARFPFAVYYRVQGENLVVLAVMHGSRHPLRWRSRSKD